MLSNPQQDMKALPTRSQGLDEKLAEALERVYQRYHGDFTQFAKELTEKKRAEEGRERVKTVDSTEAAAAH